MNCSSLENPEVVGPAEVYSSLSHWTTAVYTILGLHLAPVWAVSTITLLRLRTSSHPLLVAPLAWLVSVPPALMSLTTVGILVPSLGKYIEVLLEIVISLGMVKFIDFITTLCGGQEAIVKFCMKNKILLPIGSPPIICLIPCRKPPVTLSRLSAVAFVPGILFCYKVSVLAIDVTLLLIGHESSGNFFAIDNIHNVASIPVGLVSIYCYNMIMFIISQCVPNNSKKFLGVILLILYILFDCLRLFFIFLTGTGMLTCVPPYLSQSSVAHLLKNIIKAFLATFIGIPFLKIAGDKTELNVLSSSNQDTHSSFPESPSYDQSGILRSQSRDLFQVNREEELSSEPTYRKRSK